MRLRLAAEGLLRRAYLARRASYQLRLSLVSSAPRSGTCPLLIESASGPDPFSSKFGGEGFRVVRLDSLVSSPTQNQDRRRGMPADKPKWGGRRVGPDGKPLGGRPRKP